MQGLPPAKVLIGNLNAKLEKFNDAIILAKNGGYKKINAIRVYYTDKYVRGFEIFYKLIDGDLLKAGHNTPKKKTDLQCTIFEIGPDDYLSEIQGVFLTEKNKNKIVNITFLTYRGKAATFGGKGDKQFGYGFPGFTFGAFSGGFKKQIEFLEIDVLPLPEEFKKDFQKINVNVILGNQGNQYGGIPFVQQVVSQPYRNFGVVQMPQIAIQQPQLQKTHSYSEGVDQHAFSNQEQQSLPERNSMTSSKYPTFNKPPADNNAPAYGSNSYNQAPQPYYSAQNQQAFQQQPYSAQPQNPNGQVYNYPQYQYPGQMNIKANQQKPQYPQ